MASDTRGPVPQNMLEVPLQEKAVSRLIDVAMGGVLGPVQEDFDAVRSQLDEVLRAEMPTADAVSTYIAKNKGKGLRPALVLLAARAIGQVTPEVRTAAVGIELLQASTLLHDDVIDESPVRRGKPSINARWGNEVAVLMGDVLFTQALALFVSTGSLQVMDAAARQTRLLIEGEIFARDLRNAPDFSEESYLEIVRRKTGALMSLASEIGIILGGGDESWTTRMRDYGSNVGVAFQIVDDILDVNGDPRVVGKPTGQDVREGTVTLPLILALKAAPNGEAESIREMIRTGVASDESWNGIRTFIELHDGIAAAQEVARQFSSRAHETLRELPKSRAQTSMTRLLDYVVERRL